MAELVFFSGTMDCGKSTLALQTAYNYERRGMRGLVYTRNDRAGQMHRAGQYRDVLLAIASRRLRRRGLRPRQFAQSLHDQQPFTAYRAY